MVADREHRAAPQVSNSSFSESAVGNASLGPNHQGASNSSFSNSSEKSLRQTIFTTLLLLVSLVASVFFVFGILNKSDLLFNESGWNEVCTVLGSLFVFPVMSIVYEFVAKRLPRLSKSTESTLWFYGLRIALLCVYCVQQGLFMTYLVLYSGSLCWLFLIADIPFLVLQLISTKFTAIWMHLYIIVLAVKFGVFWPNLDQSDAADNPFANRDNQLGPNGLLATLMLTIPVIQFPVLISRLKLGMSMTEAYTTNMAAVFAHLLHFLDVLEMYMLGLERRAFASDVQSLILIFVMMGLITSNLYYIALFFNDDTVERMLQKLQPNTFDALGGGNSVAGEDESLLHYFVWVLFFIDLPYGTMRFVAFIVHGTKISTFFAKNLMMMASVIMMLVQNSKKRTLAASRPTNTPFPTMARFSATPGRT